MAAALGSSTTPHSTQPTTTAAATPAISPRLAISFPNPIDELFRTWCLGEITEAVTLKFRHRSLMFSEFHRNFPGTSPKVISDYLYAKGLLNRVSVEMQEHFWNHHGVFILFTFLEIGLLISLHDCTNAEERNRILKDHGIKTEIVFHTAQIALRHLNRYRYTSMPLPSPGFSFIQFPESDQRLIMREASLRLTEVGGRIICLNGEWHVAPLQTETDSTAVTKSPS